jgi:hypothetical protein
MKCGRFRSNMRLPFPKPSEPVLEWNGFLLYRWRGPRQRVYFGAVIESTSVQNSWDVYVRGERKHSLNTEEAARRQLEAYAREWGNP